MPISAERQSMEKFELASNVAELKPIGLDTDITWAKNRATPVYATNEKDKTLSSSDIFGQVRSKFMAFVGQTPTGEREVFEVAPKLQDRKGRPIDPETSYAYRYAIQMLHLGAIKN